MEGEPKTERMVRERDDSGQYVETVAHSDVLALFDKVDGPVLTSSDVSQELECTTEAARQKLSDLVESGQLGKRKTPARTVVYWKADNASSPLVETSKPIGTGQSAPEQPIGSSELEAIDEALEGWPESDRKQKPRREAAREALKYLVQREKARQSDFVDDVEPRASVPGQKPATWWENTVLEALNHARERGFTQSDNNNWYWKGEGEGE